ncbi:NAD-dependent epimerase/dehydratase family protein [Archangium sp.]|uniref:NAD-dependent epimerase/dehydratase family protein n=1 Tax=Archangium sp. TaxID=1872627 RepID=UPI00286D322F|nr:NAD-dependent epimerase/dehydratase family protein [Archangium sp.]
MMGSRIVVLGGAGFLGSHLCERLLEDGAAEVISVDNFLTGSERNLAELPRLGRFLSIRHDITQPLRIAGPVDYVFNMASPASPMDSAQLPIESLRVGSLGTENGLILARDKGAVFLQASTPHPDASTRYAEALVSAYRDTYDMQTRIARIFNTYGPRMRLRDGRVVPTFVGQALRGEAFTLFGDGSQTRSFCYVSDLIDGLVRLALSDVLEPVNLGHPRELTLLEFAEAVSNAHGGGGRLVFQPPPKDEPKQHRPDITRARELLGWEPRVSLEEGLVATLSWFSRQVNKRPNRLDGGMASAPL